MDVSLRHWPIFVTGLLLGAAGTMSLGLHRPTQLEMAAALAAAQPSAAPAPAEVASQIVGPEVNSQERVEEQMRAAAEGFRSQEALTAASLPFLVAVAEPPKPRVRRVPKEVALEEEAIAGPTNTAQPITASSTPASEPVTSLRFATSVMGAAPVQQVMPARGSAHAPEAGNIVAQPE